MQPSVGAIMQNKLKVGMLLDFYKRGTPESNINNSHQDLQLISRSAVKIA